MKPMPLPPPQSSAYSMPPPSAHGNHTPANTNQMLDYLESQVRGMDLNSPLLQVCNHQCSQIFVILSFCYLELFKCKLLLRSFLFASLWYLCMDFGANITDFSSGIAFDGFVTLLVVN